MKVNSASGGVGMQAVQMGPQQEDDLVSRNIKRQIEDLQKQLQELSSNTQMSGEQRMKKRQELQKQISDLDVQLRQHQIELRRQKQQEKASSDNIFESAPTQGKTKASDKRNGITQASMEAMISADTSMKQAAKQGSVATKMEGRAGVLEAEIKLDSARNGDTSAKQQELAKTEQKAENAAASQISTLDKANKAMKEAADSDKDTKESGTSENGVKETEDTENKENLENAEDKGEQEGNAYNTRVDVRI